MLAFSLAASGQYFRSDFLSRHSILSLRTSEEDWEQQSVENRLNQSFSFFKNSTVCSPHQHPHKNAWSVLHLRNWLLKTIQNTIKTWILLTFTSLCNFVIVSSINFERTLIVASAGSPPPLLSQLFPSPVPASQHLTTDAVRKRRAVRQTRDREASRAHLIRGHPTEELRQLTVPEGLPKHAYFKRKPLTK